MDYSEALTIIESSLARLKTTLPQGRWVESLELAILVEQHCRALVEECKRRLETDRLSYDPVKRSTTQIYAHMDCRCPDER